MGGTQATILLDVALTGEKLSYSLLDITFLVDENLNNYKEIHDWLLGLGFHKTIHNFKTYKQTDKIDLALLEAQQMLADNLKYFERRWYIF